MSDLTSAENSLRERLLERIRTIDPNLLTDIVLGTERVAALTADRRFRDRFRDAFRDRAAIAEIPAVDIPQE